MTRATNTLLSRRRFLTAVGAGAVSLPFLRALPSFGAGDDRRYLILIFTPNGVVRHLWGADTGAAGELVLRSWLRPLEPYRDKITIVRGLANKCAGLGDPHGPGMASLWTGMPVKNQELGGGPSIDQAIAGALNPTTPHATIEFRARSPEDYQSKDVYNRMIYSGPGAPKDPREDPVSARDQLFLGIQGGGPAPVTDPRIELRRQVFTRLDGELGRLVPRLCAEDRRHLEALRDGWSTLSGRLGGTGAGALASCVYPDDISAETAYPTVARQMVELLAMSLACDLTRIASLQFSQALSPMVPRWLGISTDHHNISHQAPHRFQLGPNAPVTSDADNPLPSQVTDPSIDQLSQIYAFYGGEIAYLCQRLSQFPVEGGKTLLDQCIIVWGNELDNGSDHDHWELPFVMIGGGAGKLRTNQIVQFPIYNGYSRPTDAILTAERAHNDLLVTLAQLMGATGITSFGNPAYNKGAISELLL